ncbi:MAG TPA: YdaS family helix-turn-helix protein [Lysobacter sp.]
MNEPKVLKQAVDVIGGQAATAAGLEVSAGLIWQWLNKKRPLPPEHCPRLEALSGVRCEALRPDIVWTRDEVGLVTGYHVPLKTAAVDQADPSNEEDPDASRCPKAA